MSSFSLNRVTVIESRVRFVVTMGAIGSLFGGGKPLMNAEAKGVVERGAVSTQVKSVLNAIVRSGAVTGMQSDAVKATVQEGAVQALISSGAFKGMDAGSITGLHSGAVQAVSSALIESGAAKVTGLEDGAVRAFAQAIVEQGAVRASLVGVQSRGIVGVESQGVVGISSDGVKIINKIVIGGSNIAVLVFLLFFLSPPSFSVFVQSISSSLPYVVITTAIAIIVLQILKDIRNQVPTSL
jgi:hypothetical protein